MAQGNTLSARQQKDYRLEYREYSHHCWSILKKATAGLLWVTCKSEILIRYSLCEQVYNLKAELGKTQSKDTYKLQKNNVIEILIKLLTIALKKKLIDFNGIFLSS